MEDNSGKKFSLQDWVMKRAANQSGASMPPLSVRQAAAERQRERDRAEEEDEILSAAVTETRVEVEMRAVSGGSAVPVRPLSLTEDDEIETPVTSSAKEVEKESDEPHDVESAAVEEGIKAIAEDLRKQTEDKREKKETAKPALKDEQSVAREAIRESVKDAAKDAKEMQSVLSSSAQNSAQQLQIVRLLSDLGDRLRQSEKEREILWKELEHFKKQMTSAMAEQRTGHAKDDAAYLSLESEMNRREVFVQELVQKQLDLEKQMKEQSEALAASEEGRTKLQEKLDSVETAAGSAIVRIEDVVAENEKLAKRIEQLGQDKVLLVHKLETVEEALVKTQETLKAKALVLLTDQTIASRTSLPQAPAWTGDDTLKVSQAVAEDKVKKEAGVVADLAASLKPKHRVAISASTAVLLGLVVLGIAGGIAFSVFNQSAPETVPSEEEQLAPDEGDVTGDTTTGTSEEDAMKKAAKMANAIEPGDLTDADTAPGAADEAPVKADTDKETVSDGVAPKLFDAAQAATDKAVEEFEAIAPKSDVKDRIKSDKTLPKLVSDIEAKALAGDGNAQHDLAAIYTAGHAGVKVNYAAAAKWFEESSHNGIANAQYNLGVLYHQGLGVKKDTAKALDMYRIAANNHHPEAEYNLAIAYVEGVGTEYNPQIAAVYFERAATGGIVEAAYNLGLLHENGLLGESQPDEAIFWYTLAADAGNTDAQKALKQLKSQLSMTDEDAARVAEKVARNKPQFTDAKGNLKMPEQKSMVEHSDTALVPVASKSPDKTENVQVTVKKAEPSAHPSDSALSKAVDKVAQAVKTVTAPKAAEEETDFPKPPEGTKGGAAPAQAYDSSLVSQIQEQLIHQGLYRGQLNGTVSPVLEQAIKIYQQKNGLRADGKPTDDLLVHMLAAAVENKAASE